MIGLSPQINDKGKSTMRLKSKALVQLENQLRDHFEQLIGARDCIKQKLMEHSDGKALKGDEIVGWLGEIYAKLLMNGILVDDSHEHDLVVDGQRVSVKARKESNGSTSWTRTSGIPKIEGDDCPTHLMFLLFDDRYGLKKVWLYPWGEIRDRFRTHVVRGQHRSYYFIVRPNKDASYVVLGY
jgi:hypothetical protein